MRNLAKRYDDKLVLNGFDLTVERGETCVIIGASGSGKRPPIGARAIDGLIERMRVHHGVTSIVISHDMVTACSASHPPSPESS